MEAVATGRDPTMGCVRHIKLLPFGEVGWGFGCVHRGLDISGSLSSGGFGRVLLKFQPHCLSVVIFLSYLCQI